MAFKLAVFLMIGVSQICLSLAQTQCACTREFRPVCGSDGETYNNPCLLNCSAFRSGRQIQVAREGPCSEVLPETDACVCPFDYTPVCGNDGRSYPNKCVLNCRSLRADHSLKMKHEGLCDTLPEPDCICPDLYKPLCATNGKTYANDCELNCATKNNPNLSEAHSGECIKKMKRIPEEILRTESNL